MSLSRETIHRAAAWFQHEAARYVTIAQEHASKAELMAMGSDKIPVNPRRRDLYHTMAREAARMAQQFLDFAVAIRLLTMTEVRLEPGARFDLPTTFLRSCAVEDFPGDGLFRLPGGEVVRAPLAGLPVAANQAAGA